MKTLAKLHAEKGLWLNEEEKPTYKDNEVLVKISKTAICGTDLHIYNWDEWAQKTIPVPMRTGHEFVGIVEAVGSEVTNFKPGDRVSGEGHLTCGHCRNCLAGRRHLCNNTIGFGVQSPGAFGEYFVLPDSNAYHIPDFIPDSVASIFDPLGNAIHAALEFDLAAEDVLVTGAGPVGLMSAAIANFVGARHVVITDVNPVRLELAKKLGIEHAINPTETSLHGVMKKLGMKEGFDVGIEMSGNEHAFRDMIEAMNYGGKISFMGIPEKDFAINWHQVVFKSLTIKGLYGRKIFDTWHKMICLIQKGLNVEPVITHEFPVEQFQKGFDAALSGEAGKVLIDWN